MMRRSIIDFHILVLYEHEHEHEHEHEILIVNFLIND